MNPEEPSLAGYLSPGYARSLRAFGTPIPLSRSGGWLLQRDIPGTGSRDAMGPYPIFACRDWALLAEDLEALQGDLVSVVLVPDPFGAVSPDLLERGFDVALPFKDHFIVDYTRPEATRASKHHRYYLRRALSRVEVEPYLEPLEALDDWVALYSTLVDRHGLRGIKAFSRAAFAEQLSLPGAVVFRASCEGVTVGAHWFFVQGDAAYSHLAALDSRGYRLGASYALYGVAIEYFATRVARLGLGAGPGVGGEGADGLSRFKRGWSNAIHTVPLCGRILDAPRYDAIVRSKGVAPSPYFPLYRRGELG